MKGEFARGRDREPSVPLPVRKALAFQIAALWMLQAEATAHGQDLRSSAAIPLTRPQRGTQLYGLNSPDLRGRPSTTDYDPINACILLLHCVHSSDRRREDDQF
jgi:hypothetical protein